MEFLAGAMYTGTYGFSQVYFLSGDGPQKQIGFQDSKLNFGVICEIDVAAFQAYGVDREQAAFIVENVHRV